MPSGGVTPAGGGGGSQPVKQAWYQNNNIVVPTGSGGAFCNVGTLQSGDALLDLTDPAQPVVLTAGRYSFTAVVGADVAAGVGVFCEIDIDANGIDFYANSQVDRASGPHAYSYQSHTLVGYCPAGALCFVAVSHNKGSDATFSLALYVERLA